MSTNQNETQNSSSEECSSNNRVEPTGNPEDIDLNNNSGKDAVSPPENNLDKGTNVTQDNVNKIEKCPICTPNDLTKVNPEENSTKSSRSGSSSEILCRICFDLSKSEDLLTPCKCKGSIGKVHLSCLEHWLGINNAHSCELCGFRFKTLRRPKYTILQSLYKFLSSEDGAWSHHGLLYNLVTILVMTLVLFVVIYSCIAMAYNYAPPGRALSAAESWASISLTILAMVFALGHYILVTTVLLVYGKCWYRWWQSQNEVRILNVSPRPHSTINFSETFPPPTSSAPFDAENPPPTRRRMADNPQTSENPLREASMLSSAGMLAAVSFSNFGGRQLVRPVCGDDELAVKISSVDEAAAP